MPLNNDHISFIIKDLHHRGVVLDGFEDEIIDHVCASVEDQMERGERFVDAYKNVIKAFGQTQGLRQTQQELIRTDFNNKKLMIRNYVKIAFRNLLKQKFYTLINISGLALGIACCLLIVLYVQHELSFDSYHDKADRIYRINGEIKFGGNHYRLAVAPAPMAEAFINEFPEVETAVRFRNRGSYLVKRENAKESFREFHVMWADSTFFKIFSVNVIQGNANSALKDVNSVAISKAMAEKYFKDQNPIGETLILDNQKQPYRVMAVFDNMPTNGHFVFDILISMTGLDEGKSTSFLSNNFNTYLLLRKGADPKALEEKFPAFVMKYVGPEAAQLLGGEFTMEKFKAAGNKLEYSLMPIRDIHLHSDLTAEIDANSDITYVYLFSAVAAFILIIACINFMNLSTARSSNRAKEVGVRKVLGSMRSHLIRQFLTESTLLSLSSFALAIALAFLALPFYNSLSQLNLSLPFSSPAFYFLLLLAALIVGMLAGVYPSFFLSAFEPVKVLKGHLALGSKSGIIRGSLVVFQFAISIFMIIATVTVQQQLTFIRNKKIGFNKDQVIMVSDAYALGSQQETFKNEVLKNSFITMGTITGYIPVNGGWRSDNTHWPEGSQPTQENMVGLQTWQVDQDYVPTMDMKIVAGRNFSREFPSDSTAVILNQTALKFFNIESDPLGKKISTFGGQTPDGRPDPNQIKSFTVIGVLEDFHFESLKQNIGPVGLFLGSSPGYASFRFKTENVQQVIAALQSSWQKLAGGQPFEYRFLDESFERMYASEQRLGKIFGVFAGLAIVIACLGLFALTAFTAEQRTKEIGIRKVLGASVSSIVMLLSKEFGKLIAIAFALSAPLAWFAIDWWLKSYTYKVSIGVFVYVLAGAGAFMVAWLTMGFQSMKAATTDPVKSLRSE